MISERCSWNWTKNLKIIEVDLFPEKYNTIQSFLSRNSSVRYLSWPNRIVWQSRLHRHYRHIVATVQTVCLHFTPGGCKTLKVGWWCSLVSLDAPASLNSRNCVPAVTAVLASCDILSHFRVALLNNIIFTYYI